MKRKRIALYVLGFSALFVLALFLGMGVPSNAYSWATTTTQTYTHTDPCKTPAADQYEECQPPTMTTTNTPPPPRCEGYPDYGPYGGKDGDENEPGHNQECCPDLNHNQVCDYNEPPPPTNGTTTQETTTTPPPTTTQPPTEPPVTETVSENPPSVVVNKPKPNKPKPTKPKPETPPVSTTPPSGGLPNTGTLAVPLGLAVGIGLVLLGSLLRRRRII